MARRLFLDTGVLVGAVSAHDPHHAAASDLVLRALGDEWGQPCTSDYVIAESMNFLNQRVHRRDVLSAFLRMVFGEEGRPPVVRDVLRIHAPLFAAAVQLHQKHFERRLSFTDCTTLAAMQEHGLRDLATFDKGFSGLANVVR